MSQLSLTATGSATPERNRYRSKSFEIIRSFGDQKSSSPGFESQAIATLRRPVKGFTWNVAIVLQPFESKSGSVRVPAHHRPRRAVVSAASASMPPAPSFSLSRRFPSTLLKAVAIRVARDSSGQSL